LGNALGREKKPNTCMLLGREFGSELRLSKAWSSQGMPMVAQPMVGGFVAEVIPMRREDGFQPRVGSV